MANESGLPIGYPRQQSTTLKYGLQPAEGAVVSARCFHTGGCPAQIAADGTDSAPVSGEIYLAEVFVPANATLTGIAIFNGSVASDSVKVGLFDTTGRLIATNATGGAGTAGNTTADSYQRIPFTATVSVLGPATYYVAVMYNGTTSRFNTFAVGNFGGGKLTGHTYATAFETTAVSGLTMPTTFTASEKPPIASLY